MKIKNSIKVIGAREHNLKNITVTIPKDRLVVFTGVSGSGKSSLVYDTLFSEAQRQFLESLSTQARNLLPKFSRADVDEVKDLSPTIMIDQKRLGRNLRSTVGTVTEIYTYLRLLFSRCGTPLLKHSALFSFNTPDGMCRTCKGLGEKFVLNEDSLIDWDKSLAEGAIKHSAYYVGGRRWTILKYSHLFDMDKPLKDFQGKDIKKLLHLKKVVVNRSKDKHILEKFTFEGIVTGIRRRSLDKRGLSESTSNKDMQFFSLEPCDDCGGSRLSKWARDVKVNGRTIVDLVGMELTELRKFIKTVKGPLAKPIAEKIDRQLTHLIDIGVGYLSLNQSVSTLSGGESQRVKMARQLGCNLVNLIYVLDEPSIGLHQRDINYLISMLKKLRDMGNSVLVVEHDPAVIESADHIIDIGPGAGKKGGNIVFEGSLSGLKKSESLLGKLLSKKSFIKKKGIRKSNKYFQIKNANLHNLKNVSVNIPQKVLSCVTGVAGSGKSSLINDTFAKEHPEAIVVDQSAVGRSTRSNPATYTGVFNLIRNEFAKATKKPASLFSFNSKGACPKCNGLGFIRVDMHFLESVDIDCDLCEGKRYTSKVLKLKHKGKNIYDVLKMTVKEVSNFFDNEEIKRRLQLLSDVGLDYLELGQPLNTLSGGEAQRIKLAKELHKRGRIYILDEPTTGLHVADIGKLLSVLDSLVEAGNTVIVIEHNLDIIKNADWIIDLGPEGGEKGGEIVAEGTPDKIMKTKQSYTGQYLKIKT